MRRWMRCASTALVALLAAISPVSAIAETIVVHVPLAVPEPSFEPPGAPCRGDERVVPAIRLGSLRLAAYERALSAIGPVEARMGTGTWIDPERHPAFATIEHDAHLFVRANPHAARRLLPDLLRRMRRELHQHEMLAELFGSVDPALGARRTRISVTLPDVAASAVARGTLARTFGGSSEYPMLGTIVVYASVVPGDAAAIEARLRALRFRYAVEKSTFITADAPPCDVTPRFRATPLARGFHGAGGAPR